MTKSSRQAAIAGYLKRDDGIDWKGLTDYANSMYDVRDELEIAEVEDNFDSETAQKAIKSKTPYLTLRPLQINPAEFRRIFRSFRTLLSKRASSMLMNRLPS